MNRPTLRLLALLTASGASVHGGVPAVQQSGTGPPVPAVQSTAIQAKDATPLADAPTTRARLPSAKFVASGAEMAEQWSPALGVALKRQSAAPTVRHEVELAHAYRDAGILDQAYDHYEAAVRRDRREAAAWDGLARIWRDWGYPDLGLGDAHRAVWADPGSPIVHNTLGTILQRLGMNQDARDQFARAAAIDPRAAYAHYNLAVVCAALCKYTDAAEAFERAAALDPSLEIARIRAIEARQGAADAAARIGGSHERR